MSGMVERRLVEKGPIAAVAQDVASPGAPKGRVYILRFGSAPCGGDSWEDFIDIVLNSPQFTPCLEELSRAGHALQTPEKALILVAPEQYSDVRHALVDTELRYYNIIIAEDLEYLLE